MLNGRIVFIWGGGSGQEIRSSNADGTDQRNLTQNSQADIDPAWSPDGSRIVFASDRDGTDYEIYLMNADGLDQRRLIQRSGNDAQPAWSPDGAKIAFVGLVANKDAIFVVNADGSGSPVRLTDSSLNAMLPDWSPDGSRIAFSADGGIYVMNADGTDPTRVPNLNGENPDWSPDSTRIAFTCGGPSVCVANANGSEQRRLVAGLAPSWSPDGMMIAFRNDSGINAVKADGTEKPYRIVDGGYAPDWSGRSAATLLRVDIGADGTWDWEGYASGGGVTTTNLAHAFNTYWASQGAPLSDTISVPVKVYSSNFGQVTLTSLNLEKATGEVRYVRLPIETYGLVSVVFALDGNGLTPVAVAADVADDGRLDWRQVITEASLPLLLTTDNVAEGVNTYLVGATGEADVPVLFYLAPSLPLTLTDFSATPTLRADLTPLSLTVGSSGDGAGIVEGNTVTLTALISNVGGHESDALVASFHAAVPGWGDTYIGSAFMSTVPALGSETASIPWNTLGFTGSVPVRVAVDPFNRLAESNENNNEATRPISITTRPDLRIAGLALSDTEPVVSQTVLVSLTLRNEGETAALAPALALYDGNPDSGGVIRNDWLGSPLSGGTGRTIAFTWTPTTTGLHRLFARADRDRLVNEFDEGNNDAWQDVFVGFRGPLLLDSGTPAERAYAPSPGYGYVDTGLVDGTLDCGSRPYETLRVGLDGQVGYRFDNMLPGHFYHLDATLYECDLSVREEWVFVDGIEVAGPRNLGNRQVHRISSLLDPALYADRTISVTVKASGFYPALVSEMNLHDVDYRYVDAGSASDLPYSAERGFGWLSGNGLQNDPLPSRSVRLNPTGDQVQYRFDRLLPDKRYQVNLTFWQPSGSEPMSQKVQVDGADMGSAFAIGAGQVYTRVVAVPAGAYVGDGSIDVAVVRTDVSNGAILNEIALEEVTLPAAPVPGFTAWPVSGPPSLVVQFTDLSTGTITSRFWNFGDGSTDVVANPTHVYSTNGVYTVSLAVGGPDGGDILTRTNFITVSSIPATTTVMISPTNSSGIVGFPVTVAVAISGVTDLGAFQFTLAYSPSLVAVEEISLGEFLSSTGRTVVPIPPVISPTLGTATFRAYSLGSSPPGPNGTGNLAYIRLAPRAAGVTPLRLSLVQASVISGTAILVGTRDGTLSIVACPGDFDGDGDIDIIDVQMIAYRYGTVIGDPLYDPRFDLDHDGDIDIVDVQSVAFDLGETCDSTIDPFPIRPYAVQPFDLSVQPSTRVVAAGQVFTSAVVISNAVNLGAFEFTMAYSPSVVAAMGAAIGPFPPSTGRTVLPTPLRISQTVGTVRFGGFSLGTTPDGPSGSGVLAEMTFRALTDGVTSLVFTAGQATDPAAVPQTPGDFYGGQVTVRTEGPSPTVPPTVTIRFQPALAEVGVRRVVTLEVWADAGNQQVNAIDAFFDIDRDHLEVVDASGHPTPTNPVIPGSALPRVQRNQADNSLGQVDYFAGIEPGSAPVTGTFLLGSLRLRGTVPSGPDSALVQVHRKTGPDDRRETVVGNPNGDPWAVISTTATVRVVSASLAGTVRLQARGEPPSNRWMVPITVTLHPSQMITDVYTTTTDTSGHFTIPDVLPGAYDIKVEKARTLRNMRASVDVAEGSNSVELGLLLEGNANQDIAIDGADYSLLASAYYRWRGDAGFDERVDFGEDGRVNALDYAVLVANYLKRSDILLPQAGIGEQGMGDGQNGSPPALTGSPVIRIEPGNAYVGFGQVFPFSVWVEAGSRQVASVDLGLDFDSDLLELVDGLGNPVAGKALTPGSALPLILGGRNIADNLAGTVDFSAGVRPGDGPATGRFLLASGYFRAKRTAGTAVISLHSRPADRSDARNVLIADNAGNELAGVFENGTAKVGYHLFLPLVARGYDGGW